MLQNITALLARIRLCTPTTTFLIGGLDLGQSALEILKYCRNLTLHRVEIQPKFVDLAKKIWRHIRTHMCTSEAGAQNLGDFTFQSGARPPTCHG